MAKFLVTMPITGYVCIEVEAEDEKDAIERAYDSEVNFNNIEEWDVHEHICEGNVFHGLMNDAEVQLIEDDE